jgi:hypothetical protein
MASIAIVVASLAGVIIDIPSLRSSASSINGIIDNLLPLLSDFLVCDVWDTLPDVMDELIFVLALCQL